eukprot:SAG11_NODE_158_length_14064_cov_6.063860_8_plen_35_part_00
MATWIAAAKGDKDKDRNGATHNQKVSCFAHKVAF